MKKQQNGMDFLLHSEVKPPASLAIFKGDLSSTLDKNLGANSAERT
jgi:hypothetical protein